MQQSSNDILNQFSNWLEKEGKSLNTITTYQRELKKYQDWLQKSDIDIENITQKDVQNYVFYLEQQGKSPITNDKILGSIRTFAKFLKRPDIISDIEITPIQKKDEIEVLTLIECDQLLNEVKKDGHKRNIAIIYTLLHTGIRVSELCALNKSDIDLNQNLVVVNTSVGEARIIPLSKDAKFHLLNYCDAFNVNEPLFTSRSSNERLTERSIQYILKKYNVNPHKLRHTFCQRLIDRGISLEIVSKLAGHKDLNVTKKYAKSRMKQLELDEAIRKTFINDTLG